MKSAIITFSCAHNIGAILQTYALQQSVHNICSSAKCFILDYKCKKIEKAYKPIKLINLKSPAGLIKSCIAFPFNFLMFMRKRRKFIYFNENFLDNYSLTGNGLKECENKFDVFITGSDQVWNYNLTGEDDSYFLDFVSYSSKKFSYAASFGNEKNFEEYKDKILKNTSDFGVISLREAIGQAELEAAGHNVRIDIDPTLLLTSIEWEKICFEEKNSEKYILIYHVAMPDKLLSQAYDYAKKQGLKVYYISSSLKTKIRHPDFKMCGDCGPLEFISLVKNAECVFTTSFHGTAFSIIFHKKFYAEINNKDGYNYRVANILNLLGLMKCADYNNILNDNLLSEEEWAEVEKKLNELRKNSLAYLKSIVEDKSC